jgi:signal transduction histidine kinase
LNNQLADIEGFSSLILMNDNDEATSENLHHMKEASKTSGRLAQNLLTAGGCVTINNQRIRLSEFMPLLESALKPHFQQAGVTLEIFVPDQVPPLDADSSRFREILTELVRNALDSAKAVQGQVMLEVHAPGNGPVKDDTGIQIVVTNTGNGIAPEKRDEIFRPFVTTKNAQHFGLGLPICLALSQLMGMRLGVSTGFASTSFVLCCPPSQ